MNADNIEKIRLPGSDNERTIITIKAMKQVPNMYPRKAGTPTNYPL